VSGSRAITFSSGLLFAGLSGGAVLGVPRPPEAGAAPHVLVAYVTAHQNALEAGWLLGDELAWLPALVFFAGLAALLRELGAPVAALATGILGASVTAAIAVSLGASWGVLVYLAPQLTQGQLVLVLMEIRHFGDAAASVPMTATLLGFGFAGLQCRSITWRLAGIGALGGAFVEVAHVAVDFLTGGQTGVWLTLATLMLPMWACVSAVAIAEPRVRRLAVAILSRPELVRPLQTVRR
jgi:hypothetical protein